MTFDEGLAVAVVSGFVAVIGQGGIKAIVTQWLANRKNAETLDADLKKTKLQTFREDSQKTLNNWADCERRCGELTAENRTLKSKVEALSKKVSDLEKRNIELVEKIAKQRSDIDMLLSIVRPKQ